MKSEFVVNDMLLLEEFCNLACLYCGDYYPSEFRFKSGNLNMPDSWKRMVTTIPGLQIPDRPTIEDLVELGKRVIEATNVKYYSLKLSGGEVFMYPKINDFISSLEGINSIQILTNGLKLRKRDLHFFKEMGNVSLQVSMDGPTLETNITRTRNQKIHDQIVSNVKYALGLGFDMEVNCVLTKYNIDAIQGLAQLFADSNSIIFPRPVRGPPALSLAARNGDNLLNLYKDQSIVHVLPPIEYMIRVTKLYQEDRDWQCYVPFFVLGVDNYGKIKTCTCSGELPEIGNVFKDVKIVEGKNYYSSRMKPPGCRRCITQYDVFNLLTDGHISLDEFKRIPSLRGGERYIKNVMSEIK